MSDGLDRTYYPIFLDLSGRLVVVVGGGGVAERKVMALVACGAVVRVVSRSGTSILQEMAAAGEIAFEARGYRAGDLSGALMAFAATGDSEVNRAVSAEADRLGVLCNVADSLEECDFIVPSVVQQGALQIAVSTGGAAPAVARDIRRSLEGSFDAAWGDYVRLLGEMRVLVLARVTDGGARKAIFDAIAGAGLLERLRAGESLTAEQVFLEFVGAGAL